jgi:hypothetical protein
MGEYIGFVLCSAAAIYICYKGWTHVTPKMICQVCGFKAKTLGAYGHITHLDGEILSCNIETVCADCQRWADEEGLV